MGLQGAGCAVYCMLTGYSWSIQWKEGVRSDEALYKKVGSGPCWFFCTQLSSLSISCAQQLPPMHPAHCKQTDGS